MRKLIIFSISLILLLFLMGCSGEPVTFKDKDFELAVRKNEEYQKLGHFASSF
ncbi:MAG: hypothetical protein R6V17_08725 [Halanaerobacter sp.]